MTTIRDVINAFAAVEEGLEVAEPYNVKINRVYKYLPPAADSLDLPCIMHQYRPVDEDRLANDQRVREYAVRMDVLLDKLGAQSDIQSEIGAAFDEVIVSAFDADVLLGDDQASYNRLFDFGGSEYQPALLDWNGVAYVALRYEWRVIVRDTKAFGA